MHRAPLLVLGLALATACSEPASLPAADGGRIEPDGGATPMPDAGRVPSMLGPEDRRARITVPPQHDGTTRLPLVIMLHGYSASGALQEIYFRANAEARRAGFYLLYPDGLVDSRGNRFWNAMPACCDFDGTRVDDVAYLTALLDEAIATLPIDEERVYFIGHSNGGFMSYRMACALSDRIAAIMSLAGADYPTDMDCVPAQPVSVLQVHGDMDDSVAFEGGALYPSARDITRRWATRGGCADTPTMGERLDIDTGLDGAETTVTEWSTGCAEGHDYAFWHIESGTHIPAFGTTWMQAVSGWLLRHRR